MASLLRLLLLVAITGAQSKPCPPCGSTAVPFPLSTSPSCNDPGYPITCNSTTGKLTFTALNSSFPTRFSYPIVSISPAAQRLVISPAPLHPPSACISADFPRRGLSLNASLPFNITSSNTLFYLNCTSRLLQSPLDCSTTSPCRRYLDAGGAAACRSAGICCVLRAGGGTTAHDVRTTGTGCSAYTSIVGLDAARDPVGSWVEREGVELQWASPREPACGVQEDCEDGSNATCRADPAGGGRRCFCVEGLVWDPVVGVCAFNATDCRAKGDCRRSNHGPLIAGLVSGISAALLLSTALCLLHRRRRRIRADRDRVAREREEILNSNNTAGGRRAHYFTGQEIKRATNNFSRHNLLGSGGYGEVFRGGLPDGTPIAVKVAKLGSAKSTDQVLNEVRILSQVNHRNLVRLLGCCVELEQPVMVYEYIPNGNLYEHLHGPRPPLPWRRRLSVANQTARGLSYLHFSAVQPIYHRDVKSSNILLDEAFDAKVADFGLSRLAEADLSHVSTCAQGTLGYLDPEYYRSYQLTDRSDVYSFGVVLLELLTSQRAIDFARGPEDVNLAVYVQRMVEEGRVIEVVDPRLTDGAKQIELDTMKAIGFLAVSCLEEKRQNRPSMKEVTEEIEYIMKIEASGGVDREHDDAAYSR